MPTDSAIRLATTSDTAALMRDIGARARAAARKVALAPAEVRNRALLAMAEVIRDRTEAILAANALDLNEARARGQTPAFIDRLLLDEARVASISEAVASIAALPDPVGKVLERFDRPNGLRIEKVATPLGVIAVIFESRPNVTADAGALCLKSGNAAILRAGSESFRTSSAIADCLQAGLRAAGLPQDAIQLVPTRDREAVGAILAGLDGNVDVVVPRGGRSLVARVQDDARVPVFAHLDGNCHVYVAPQADLDMAKAIVLNAKLRRTGICGSAETLLVDRAVAPTHLKPLVAMLLDAGCAVRGDAATQDVDPRVAPAIEADWGTEYLAAIIAVKVVDGVDAAIAHIERYGSHHTDAIVTGDEAEAARFLAQVDSAIVLHNASTQFGDGGEFGFGAEIGIATGRMHARGPVGVEQLCSFNYRVRGTGQIRPVNPDAVFRHADLALPPHAPGMTIGLFGGSFNPAHDGHRLASLTVLRRLGLDRIWWLVTPGNPLKDNSALPSQHQRMALARSLAHHPRIVVTGVEASFGTRYTADTLRQLKRRCPGVRFVWIMGADNLAGFHRWQEWREIARMMPLAIVDRPGSTNRAVRAKAAVALGRYRLDETDGRLLAHMPPPAWAFVHGRRSFLSSTGLRNAAKSNAAG